MAPQLAAFVGWVASAVGAALLYLASPNQRATERPQPRRALLAGGAVLQVVSLAGFLGFAGPATAVFLWVTAAMLFWSVPPLAAVFKRREGRGR